MSDDPLLSQYGHPLLPAGVNSWEVNGDELNGPGANEPVWPDFLDAFVPLRPLLLDENDMAMFDSACVDLCVKGCRRKAA